MYTILLIIHIAAGSVSILTAPLYMYMVRKQSVGAKIKNTLVGTTITTILAGLSLLLFGTNITRLCVVLAAYSIGIGAVLYFGGKAGNRSDCPYLSE